MSGQGDDVKRNGSNRERILDTSLALFNRMGFSAVTTNFIAQELGISPGNLYYHFRNKEAIARELYGRTREVVETSAASRLPMNSADVASTYRLALDNALRFRFAFVDFRDVMRDDPPLAAEHRALLARATDQVHAMFESFRAESRFRVPELPPAATRRCAVTTTVVITGWWQYLEATDGAEAVTSAGVTAGARQAFSVIEPHLTDAFAAEVIAGIEAAR